MQGIIVAPVPEPAALRLCAAALLAMTLFWPLARRQ
jgi:hypothetical protein